ncbi:MAG: hypothetical protein ABSB70_02105 [Candidatus Velthaea sp.]
MDDLMAFIAAIFDALSNRKGSAENPAAVRSPSGQLGRALRDALTERVAPPNVPPPREPGGAARAAAAPVPAPPRAPAPPPPAPLPPAASGPGGPAASRRPAAAAFQAPEAGRITALFSGPQALVAAFVVAEVLSPPVALRGPSAGLVALNLHGER